VRRALPLLLLPLLVGCGTGAVLTIHNGTATELTVTAGPGRDAAVPAGALHHFEGIESALELVATDATGGRHTVSLPLPPPGGAAIWDVGGAGCFAEGDFSSYYTVPVGVPAGVEVLGMLEAGEELYVSSGKVSASPGRRLPKGLGGGSVRALVQVPCDAVSSEPIARGWLEMKLPEIEPK